MEVDETIRLDLTGKELKLLGSALFMATCGLSGMEARDIGLPHDLALNRLADDLRTIRDRAWAPLAPIASRPVQVAARAAISVVVELPSALLRVLARLLRACVDDSFTRSELSSFTGVLEYAVDDDDFRSLASRFEAILPRGSA